MDERTIFGQLYIAVFSNGTVKAGMSKNDTRSRLMAHENAGKAFCICMESSYIASIHTDDVLEREKKMHSELRKVSKQTAGKEWFMFNNKYEAKIFCSRYIESVESDSFENKDKTCNSRRVKKTKTDLLINSLLPRKQKFVELSKQDNDEIEAMFANSTKQQLMLIATNVLDFHDYVTVCAEDSDYSLQYLDKVIDEEYSKFIEADDKQEYTEDARELLIKGFKVSGMLSQESAKRIIKTAMGYGEFFYEVCNMKEVD